MWLTKNYEIETSASTYAKGNFNPKKQMDLIVSSDQISDCIDCHYIIDGRGEAGHEKGHIESAINIPFRSLLSEDGLFKDQKSLSSLFDEKIPDWKTRPIVSSCGSGYAGAVVAFALRTLGVTSPLYDDSYSVYCKLS